MATSRTGLLIASVALLAMLLTGCTGEPGPTAESTAAPVATPTDMPTPPTTAAPAATAATPLSAVEVYGRVSPSIPFVQTPVGRGSGVLIEGGYVVTNYHVVWPYDTVALVFPRGKDLQHVPVVGWDFMSDLAVLGPVSVSAAPLTLEDGEGMPPGSELFLVGYPAEMDELPEPTITRGVLSRLREWERFGMTYLQTDAAIAGGQSGGALVSSRGEVVGISTYSFSEAGFGLATSGADVAPIVRRLIQGGETAASDARRVPAGRGSFEFRMELANLWDTRAFFLDGAAGTLLQVQLDGAADGKFRVDGPAGLLLDVDEVLAGVEEAAVELAVDGIHFLQVEIASGTPSPLDLISTIRLKPFHDPDDGPAIAVGDTVAGNVDFPSDWDWYSIRLAEGETVRISADSVNVDTLVVVDFPASQEGQAVFDDDSGGGLFGTNSELVYRAPGTGEYLIAVTDAVGDNTGGYYVSVEQAPAGSETVHVPAARVPRASADPEDAGRAVVASPFGDMTLVSPSGNFEMLVPAHWIQSAPEGPRGVIFTAFDPDERGGVLVVVAESGGRPLMDGATDFGSLLVAQGAGGFEARETVTAQGDPAIVLEIDDPDSQAVALVYVSDDGLAILVLYGFEADVDEGRELAMYSFESFRYNAAD